jgi:hypothetical protein
MIWRMKLVKPHSAKDTLPQEQEHLTEAIFNSIMEAQSEYIWG